MEYTELIKLMEAMSASELVSFKYETKEEKISFSKAAKNSIVVSKEPVVSESAPVKAGTGEITGSVVKSPLVGTFYASPGEGEDPYVTVGDRVKKGQVLAIVEAMKLMNEIECEYDGIVTDIFVKNGEPVEYGQPLFSIRAEG